MIPFVDLKSQYASIKNEVQLAINNVLESCSFVQGKYEQEFSKNFSKAHGVPYGAGCSNGTSAITLALRALGIGQGDEVITVNNTFYATVEAIYEVGANAVLIDCLESNYGMDPDKIEEKITSKTKAIIPVHLYGHPCNMPAIKKIASRHNLKIIEDCAQAHFAKYDGDPVGSVGDVATFSFYPGKNLGAYGDAGFVISKNEETIEKVRCLLNHGRQEKYTHDILAGNYRMDDIQAAILDVKLKYLNEWTDKRIACAKIYDNLLSDFKIIEKDSFAKAVYHLYIVEVSNRDEVMAHLKSKEISSGVHYPITMANQPALSFLNLSDEEFPVSSSAAQRIMSLPIFPELTRDQQHFIVEEFLKVARK